MERIHIDRIGLDGWMALEYQRASISLVGRQYGSKPPTRLLTLIQPQVDLHCKCNSMLSNIHFRVPKIKRRKLHRQREEGME